MCRNIRVLHHFQPPTTVDEIRAASLQYVRKVSGLNKPSPGDLVAFNRALDDIAKSTERLLGALLPRGEARTRERERERARERWMKREAATLAKAPEAKAARPDASKPSRSKTTVQPATRLARASRDD